MEPIEIIVIIASVAIVLSVFTAACLRKIKNKKSGCASGCCGCAYSAHCEKNSPTNQKQKANNREDELEKTAQ